MEVTVEIALEELKHICSQWILLGHYLQVKDLNSIAANCAENDEHCLKEVLKDWLKNGKDPSWKLLCSSLEACGWLAEAKRIREKYTTSGVSILMKDMKGETASFGVLGIWSKKSLVEVPRGELLKQVEPKGIGERATVYLVTWNEAITVRCEAGDVTPLSGVQCALLMAIPNPMERFAILMTDGWLDWGATVKAGDSVNIRIMMMDQAHCCEARVLYIGSVTQGQTDTIFGVEITDSKYYGCGNTDGTLHDRRYFSCSVGNGLFLLLASVAKQPEWLMSHQKRRNVLCASSDTAHSRSEVVNMKSNQLIVGTRVIVRPKDGRKIRGTVRWVGQLPLEGTTVHVREEVPVYGIETDVKVGWTDFLPEFSPVNKSTFNVTNAVHGKVFVPVSMVEPYDETGGYDVIDKSVNEKDAHAEVCAAYERNGDTPVMNELMLADGLGPEVVGDTNMQMQVELLKRFENERAQMQQLSSLQNVLESQYSAAAQILALDDQTAHQSVGLTVLIPNSFPRRLGTIRWIGQILMLGYFAGVEVEIPVDGYTDGVCLLNGVRYFTCPPNRALYCQLGQLLPYHQFISESAFCNDFNELQMPVDEMPMDATVKLRIIQNLSIGSNAKVEEDIFICNGEAGYYVVGVVKILEPMSPMLNYVEYQIINRGERCGIGIGVGEIRYPLDRMPGWNVNGIGYHSDDGRLYYTRETSSIPGYEPFGPTSTTGDRMGCGVDFDSYAGYGYVNIFFTRNGQQVGGLIKMKRPTHGLYPLVGLISRGEKVRYLGHSWRVPRSISPPLDLNLSPWLRSNGVRFRDDGLTVEYCGKGLQLEGHDVGVAQANITANSGNHYFEMEILSAGEEGLLAIGFAEPTYPLHLYPGSTKGSIAYHTGHLYKEVVPLGSTQSMKCNRIGCGIQFEDTACNEPTARTPQEPVCKVFFIKDGEAIGTVECSIPSGGFYPFVAILSLGGKVRVNFNLWTGGTDVRIKSKNDEVKQVSNRRSSVTIVRNESMPNQLNICDHSKVKHNQVKMEHFQVKKELEDLRAKHSNFNKFWIVPRHQVTLMERTLGGGAWGYVKEGKFRGQNVAVKCIHEDIVTQRTIKRVHREICSMAHLHHPNLVLFIAAVLDDQGGPMIITELLDTTLRKAYENNLLHPDLDQCMDIFRDVASALCYLHELEEPIIHRDVSSANVILQALANDKWNAKLSDFGSANWAKEASTMGEGAIVYTAPEAYPVHPSHRHRLSPQTTKIDVYSYGILLCEVTLRELPSPEYLNEMKEQLKTKHFLLHSIVQKCTEDEPMKRPTMASVLEELCGQFIHQEKCA